MKRKEEEEGCVKQHMHEHVLDSVSLRSHLTDSNIVFNHRLSDIFGGQEYRDGKTTSATDGPVVETQFSHYDLVSESSSDKRRRQSYVLGCERRRPERKIEIDLVG